MRCNILFCLGTCAARAVQSRQVAITESAVLREYADKAGAARRVRLALRRVANLCCAINRVGLASSGGGVAGLNWLRNKYSSKFLFTRALSSLSFCGYLIHGRSLKEVVMGRATSAHITPRLSESPEMSSSDIFTF
ncbi:unnamed protein product, partial [Brenthis ino]